MLKDESFGVVPVFVDQNNVMQFLLVQHAAGHWSFPKGHKEAGETSLMTARRELAEETGIAGCYILTSDTFQEIFLIPANIKTPHKPLGEEMEKTVLYYVGQVQTNVISIPPEQKNEIFDCKWFTYEEALKKITFKEAREVLVNVYKSINNK
jgi:8-oxo-dGTP pyrophosphatase MutT (NUDIX family)